MEGAVFQESGKMGMSGIGRRRGAGKGAKKHVGDHVEESLKRDVGLFHVSVKRELKHFRVTRSMELSHIYT